MSGTLRIRIRTDDGAIYKLQIDTDDVKAFLADLEHNGYYAPHKFYPADSILTIEVGAPDEFPGELFGVN